MSAGAALPPPALRALVARDLSPVRPIAPPGRRALALATVAAGAIGALAAFAPHAAERLVALLPAVGAEFLAGLALVWLALREGVPGSGVGRGRAFVALALGLAVELGAILALATDPGAGWLGSGGAQIGLQCAAGQGALALPLVAGAIWLLLRAFPLRARLASALAGAAAGLFANAAWHLVCARTDLGHLLVWHLGTTLLLAGVGYLAGAWPERRTAPAPLGEAAR